MKFSFSSSNCSKKVSVYKIFLFLLILITNNMKNSINTALLVLMALLLLQSCSKSDDSPTTTSIVTSGTWRVTYYWDKDKDETSDFTGFNFVFNNSGSLTATRNSSSVTGSWSYSGSDDSNDKLIINLAGVPLESLSDDWHITEKSETLIKLEDQSGSGGVEYLYFTKN
jgi:outer membrane biogenesis lipoprotein LolB